MKSKKEKLKDAFESSCNAYARELEKMWNLNHSDGYWIGDDVGGVYDNGGFVTLELKDLIFCVDNDISFSEYDEWSSYCITALELGFNEINLKSWHMGAPRVTEETFKRIRVLRDMIGDFIESENKRCKDGEEDRTGSF